MHAHEHVAAPGYLTLDERHVVLLIDQRTVADDLKLAEGRRQLCLGDTLDELVGATAIGDQVGNRDHLQLVPRAVAGEVVHPRHRPVVVHHLADHPRGVQPGQARQIDSRLSLPGALEHAPGTRLQREDMPRLNKIAGVRLRIDRHLNRSSTVMR